MNAKPAASGGREWTLVSDDPPTVRYRGELWLVCPVNGFDCARMPRNQFGEQMAADVMAVHVAISHTRWS